MTDREIIKGFIKAQEELIEWYDKLTAIARGEEPIDNSLTLADAFLKYEGTKEYEGVVEAIQTWYYGYVSTTAWCATSLIWMMAQLGIYRATLGYGQNWNNVYYLEKAFQDACKRNSCLSIKDPRRGDVVFLCFDKAFGPDSRKHVTVYMEEAGRGEFVGVGGNQDDSICRKKYALKDVKSIYRPNYSLNTRHSLEELPDYG